MFILLVLQLCLIFLLHLDCTLCYACGPAEYKIGIECCSMCGPGSRVYKHCTEWTSTLCAPCVRFAFTDKANGLEQCYPCTVCDREFGLKPVKPCTPSSDTVCGVLEGYYCINAYEGRCRAAHRHSACEPGQFIKQPGTTSADTTCMDCQKNTYSNGTFTSCKPHTDCESIGLITVKPGDPSSDSECGERSQVTVIGLAAGLSSAAVIVLIAGIVILKRQRKTPTSNGHTARRRKLKPQRVQDDGV